MGGCMSTPKGDGVSIVPQADPTSPGKDSASHDDGVPHNDDCPPGKKNLSRKLDHEANRAFLRTMSDGGFVPPGLDEYDSEQSE